MKNPIPKSALEHYTAFVGKTGSAKMGSTKSGIIEPALEAADRRRNHLGNPVKRAAAGIVGIIAEAAFGDPDAAKRFQKSLCGHAKLHAKAARNRAFC